MVAFLVAWCWRATTKGHWARYSAVFAAVLLANEALLGAALVLLGHVAKDQSIGRVLFLGLHFSNTLLLLATLALTATWLRSGSANFTVIRNPHELAAIVTGLLATTLIGITGTVAAPGDTLFPARSLKSSILRDFTSGAPALLRLRLLHPVIAVLAGTYVVWVVFKNTTQRQGESRTVLILILFAAQFSIGLINVSLLAPVWVQVLHLFVADGLWITLVLASADLALEPAAVRPACAANGRLSLYKNPHVALERFLIGKN